MYTISKVPEGIILTCKNCTHIESTSQFKLSLGSQRTQAARAMQAHHAGHNATHDADDLKLVPSSTKSWRRLR